MVLISSKKYACETCIKGHRSSTCKHTDRPLYEIKKKGRPVTQCEHCRELRKTKQVHVKCICEVKEDTLLSQPSGNGKRGTKIPSNAAFPNGLPEDLEAAVVLQTSEGLSSDSCHGGSIHNSCTCKINGPCTCWTPRQPTIRKKTATESHASSNGNAPIPENPTPSDSVKQPQSRLSMSHILARVKELRPVLPRPASSNSSNGGPVHELSSGLPHSHPNRYHMHETLMFSPYERAHDRTHDHPLGHDKIFSTSPSTSHIPSPTGHSHPDHPPSSEASIPQPSVTQPGNMLFSGDLPNLSACNCGANCGCGDCVKPIQPPNTVPSPDSQCTNPNACTTCLECSFFRNFAPPSATSQPVLDANQRIAIDEWIRQVSSLKSGPDIPTFVSAFPPQEYPHLDEPTSQVTQVKNQPDLTSNSWHESLLAPSINIPPSNHSDEYRTYASTPERCANQCNCPPGSCICQREECVTVERSPIEPAAFAVSRERASCCASKLTQLQMIQGMSRSDTHLVLPDTYQSRPLSAPYGNAELYRQYVPNATELPFSASTSALDITRRPAYLNINGGQASAGQAYLDLPVPITNGQTSSLANYTLAWVAASNYDGTTAPVMPYYAISNPGTDGTSSSYDDLSMTLRTQL